jgi:hypothetical protein
MKNIYQVPSSKPQKILFILAIYLLLIGCLAVSPQEGSEERGESILRTITCQPPCWEGVIPGETSKQELMAKLQSIAKGDDSIIDRDEGLGDWDDIVSFYLYSQYGQKINFFITDDVVVEIDFYWKLYLTLGDAIELLGDPDWVYPTVGHNGAVLIILYEEGVALLHEMKSGIVIGGTNLEPQSEIVEMSFFDASNWAFGKNVLTRDDLKKYGYEWAGYGDIDEKYPMPLK